MKPKLTEEERIYNLERGAFKRRINSNLKERGIFGVEPQLEFIQGSQSPELYKGIVREDAIEIIEKCIEEYKESLKLLKA